MTLIMYPNRKLNQEADGNVALSTSYTMGCPPVCEDNPRALASGLSYVLADNP